ncbi:GTPase [Muriicola soli]|uniref:GTPase n=2 Tax=Muriicola soli TaxID=2507538 RepID=A0A411ED36_9FLAO|nr:GTPase [Muriicola soli]
MNELFDAAHKVLNPATYQCRLCELTFGNFREKATWKKFRKKSDISMEFLHKDEFLAQYSSKFMPKYSFPIVLEITDHNLEQFLGTKEINELQSTEELIGEINQRLA